MSEAQDSKQELSKASSQKYPVSLSNIIEIGTEENEVNTDTNRRSQVRKLAEGCLACDDRINFLERTKSELQRELDKVETQTKELEEKLKLAKEKYEALPQATVESEDKLQKQEQEHRKEMENLRQNMEQLKMEIANFEVQHKKLMLQIENLSKEKEELIRNNSKLDEELKKSSKRLGTQEDQSQQLKTQLRETERKKGELESKVKELEEQIETKESERLILKKNEDEKINQMEPQQQKLIESEKLIQQLTAENSNLTQINKDLKREIENKEHNNKRLLSEVENLNVTLSSLMSEKEDFFSTANNLQTEKNEFKNSIQKLEGELSELGIKNEQHAKMNKILKEEKTALIKSKDELNSEFLKLQAKGEMLAKEKSSQLTKLNEDLSKKLSQGEAASLVLTSKVKTLEDEKTELAKFKEIEISNLKKENEAFILKNTRSIVEKSELITMNEDLKTSMLQMKNLNTGLNLKIKTMEDERAQLSQKNQALLLILEEQQEKIEKQQEKIEKYSQETQISLLNIKKREINQQLNQPIAQLNQEIAELSNRMDSSQENYEGEIKSLSGEKAELQKHHNEEATKLRELLEKLNKQTKELDEQLRFAEKKLQSSIVFKPPIVNSNIPFQSIKTPSFCALPKAGWAVSSGNNVQDRMNQQSPIVGVLGPAGSGKNWLSAQISKGGIPAELNSRSNSITLFYPQPEKNSIGILLNSNWNESIRPNSKELKSWLPPIEIAENAQVRRDYAMLFDDAMFIDELKIRFMINTAGILIVVVSNMNQSDLTMLKMIKQWSICKNNVQVITVHNFNHLSTIHQVKAEIEGNLKNIFDLSEAPLFTFSGPLNGDRNGSLFKDEFGDTHLIMASEDTPAGDYFNMTAIEFLSAKINTLGNKIEFHLENKFREYCTNVFFHRTGEKAYLEFDSKSSMIRMIKPEEIKRESLRQIVGEYADNLFAQEGYVPAHSIVEKIDSNSDKAEEIMIEAVDCELLVPKVGKKFFILTGRKKEMFSIKENEEKNKGNVELKEGTRKDGNFELKIRLPQTDKKWKLKDAIDIGPCMKKYIIQEWVEEQEFEF